MHDVEGLHRFLRSEDKTSPVRIRVRPRKDISLHKIKHFLRQVYPKGSLAYMASIKCYRNNGFFYISNMPA
jgi:hypothetical protein